MMRKGVSPTVSFVLTVATIIVLSSGAYIWANDVTKSMDDPGRVNSYYNQMKSLDFLIRETAHGDINFTSRFEFYYPTSDFMNPFLYVIPDSDSLALRFYQNAQVIGYSNTSANETCEGDFVRDNSSRITMYRETPNDRVYKGSSGPGAGLAEVMVCYPNIDLVNGQQCASGGSGPTSTVVIRKTGVSSGRPVISIDIC